jgi:polar amino acid transport system permease protein
VDNKPDPLAEEERKIALVPGAEPSARNDPWWWLVALVVAIAAILIIASQEYHSIFNFILRGLGVTVIVTLVSYILMLIVGMFGALGRLSKNFIFHGLSSLYVEIVRGIPLLVQLIMCITSFLHSYKNSEISQGLPSCQDGVPIPSLWRYSGSPSAMGLI